jgi:serine/threonine protein kinase
MSQRVIPAEQLAKLKREREQEREKRKEGKEKAGALNRTSSGLVLPKRVKDPVEEIKTILRVDDDTPVVVLNDYEYDELPIGSGSFSEVYRVVNPDGLVRAIKEFRLGIGARDHRTYTERRKLFEREFRAYRSLGGHEQIPDFHAIGARLTRDGKFRIFQPGIVMEYVDGKTLADRLKVKEGFSPDEVRDVLMQSLSPLSKIHHGNSVPRFHRDLKPANLKRSSSGRLYVLDFGEIRDSLLRTGGRSGTLDRGTLGYAHRLQLEGNPSFRTDLYSLGRVLYAIATGQDLRSSDRFERKLIDRTNLDSEMRNVIQMLCDESLGGVQDVASLEDYLKRKPIEVQGVEASSGVEPYETRYDIPVIKAESSLDEQTKKINCVVEREIDSLKIQLYTNSTGLKRSLAFIGIGIGAASAAGIMTLVGSQLPLDEYYTNVTRALSFIAAGGGACSVLGGIGGNVILKYQKRNLESRLENAKKLPRSKGELKLEVPKTWVPAVDGLVDFYCGLTAHRSDQGRYVLKIKALKSLAKQGVPEKELEEMVIRVEEARITANYKKRHVNYDKWRTKNRNKRRGLLNKVLKSQIEEENIEFWDNLREYRHLAHEGIEGQDPYLLIKRWKMRRVLARTKAEFNTRYKYDSYSARIKELPFSPETQKIISDAMWSAHYDGYFKQEYITALREEFKVIPEIQEMIEDIAGKDFTGLRE